MPSRKRNKGKDRKAKKAEQEAKKVEKKRVKAHNIWQKWTHGIGKEGRELIHCNHGFATIVPDENHPVSSFMDSFYINWESQMTVVPNLKNTFQTHPQVWNNGNYREMVINILIRIGTNLLLAHFSITDGIDNIAQVIAVLEKYEGSGDFESTINSRRVAGKIRDLYWSHSNNVRDVLKFFRKRTSCKCLKAMHLEARKTLPKLGVCYHCMEGNNCEQVERASLMVCSRCRVAQYCSRKCQLADWSMHKCRCDVLYDTHQRGRQND